ncbi:endonuclease/exonuclease/phosphatase family protein [Nocardia sp. NPDC127579]|uniref:endonuclease/exonuclease/phosphatase family protein n=1 Tax=Nocardia sp. NPDC127579 TaxID=3345402 RepID=UPI0036283006
MAIPADVTAQAARLRSAVSDVVPARTDANLIIGTWNLREFGNLTPSWNATSSDSPKRDWRAITLIAQVIAAFDVCAVQELQRNTNALRFLLARLGPDWRAIASDVTEGDNDTNGERLAYLYDSTRVQPSGLVGEIVLPPAAGDPARQFVRTPYAASFTRADVEFILTTVHILWGADPSDRLPELTAFAQWMRDWNDRPNDWNDNLFVLGDFNLDRLGDPLFDAFVSTGLWAPTELNTVDRTIFGNDNTTNYYDQIAWFSTPDDESLLTNLTYTQRAGHFDFLPHCYPTLTRTQTSFRISDHYPLWVEFHIDT